jgi:hypothetical protein
MGEVGGVVGFFFFFLNNNRRATVFIALERVLRYSKRRPKAGWVLGDLASCCAAHVLTYVRLEEGEVVDGYGLAWIFSRFGFGFVG